MKLLPSTLLLIPLASAVLAGAGAGARLLQDPAQDAGDQAGQDQEPEVEVPVEADVPTLAGVKQKLEELAADTLLEAERKQALIEVYGNVRESLESQANWDRKARDFETSRETAPSERNSVQDEFDGFVPATPPMIAWNARLANVEQSLSQAQRRLETAQADDSAFDKETRRRAERRSEIPARFQEIRQELRSLDSDLAATVESPTQEETAGRWLRLARRLALQAESDANELEVETFELRKELLDVQGDLAQRRVVDATRVVTAWQELVDHHRAREARKAARDAETARRRVDRAHPALRDLAERNADLAEERSALVLNIEELTATLANEQRQLEQITASYEDVKERETQDAKSQTDLSRDAGRLLREQRSLLPAAVDIRQRAVRRQRQIVELNFRQNELSVERETAIDVDASVETLLGSLAEETDDAERARVETEARGLWGVHSTYLKRILADYDRSYHHLLGLETTERLMADTIEEFQAFIDQRTLWIASSPPLWATDFGTAGAALGWLTSPEHWGAAARTLGRDIRSHWGFYTAGALLLGAFIVLRRRLVRLLGTLGTEAHPGTCWRMQPTWRALGITAILIVPLALCCWLLGWRLLSDLDAPEFTRNLGRALEQMPILLVLIEIPRQVMRKDGLGDHHFGWTRSGHHVARDLTWLLAVVPLLAICLTLINGQSDNSWQESTGRCFLIAAQLVLAACLHFILGPGRRPPGSDEPSLERFRWRAAYVVGVGTPAAMAVLAILGYVVTSSRLTGPFLRSVVIVFCVALAHAVVHRWLLVTRRRLSLEQVRRARLEAAAGEDGDSEEGDEQGLLKIDLDSADVQSRRMFRRLLFIGAAVWLWVLWSNALALDVLQNLEVWTTGVGDAESVATLGDLLAAVLGLTVTVIAARNLPGVLDLTLLRRIPMRPGDRLVLTTVSSYLILLVGVFWCMNKIGLGWGQMQWMAAAVSVGLGFGLQEIFANFVSGVIILFERPIRIGDLVTVGQITGRVTNIKIRATTITDFDRRELIVPNKEFVTSQLVNWTLSDTVTRVVFPVRVMRSTDPKKTAEVLERIARFCPLVLREPAPDVVFLGFDENALKLDLRVFIAERSTWVELLNTLNLAIHREFAKEGLEMATEQRDLRIQTLERMGEIFGRHGDVSVEELGHQATP